MGDRFRFRFLVLLVSSLLVNLLPFSVEASTGDIGTYVGGPATLSIINRDDLYYPLGVAVDHRSGAVYIADTFNHRIQMVSGTVVTTVAGVGIAGFFGEDWPAIDAELNKPQGLALDASGNLYIADTENNRIRRISPGTDGVVNRGPGELIKTVVGTDPSATYPGDGKHADLARLKDPRGLTIDDDGNLYISEYTWNRVRVVPAGSDGVVDGTETINTVAGNGLANPTGSGTIATATAVIHPAGLAVDQSGYLYIAEGDAQIVQRVSPGTDGLVGGNDPGEIITTFAGTGNQGYLGDQGQAASAWLSYPYALAFDEDDNLFIADAFNNRIRRVDSNGVITTVVGSGLPAFSNDGPAARGDGGPAGLATLLTPFGLGFGPDGTMALIDRDRYLIRSVSAGTDGLVTGDLFDNEIISTIAGTNAVIGCCSDESMSRAHARLKSPQGMAVTSTAGVTTTYIADTTNHRIVKIADDGANSTVTTVAGIGCLTSSACAFTNDAYATATSLSSPTDVKLHDGHIYVADSGNNVVRMIDDLGRLVTVAGSGAGDAYSGDGSSATMTVIWSPTSITFGSGGKLYIAAKRNNRILMVSTGSDSVVDGGPSETVTTVAGPGPGTSSVTCTTTAGDGLVATSACLNQPYGLVIDGSGALFIADTANNRVRRVEAGTDAVVNAGPSETMTTVAGNGTATTPGNAPVDGIAATLSTLNQPTGLVISGTSLLIADRNNHRIRKVVAGSDGYVDGIGTETISTFAGTLPSGYYGDVGQRRLLDCLPHMRSAVMVVATSTSATRLTAGSGAY